LYIHVPIKLNSLHPHSHIHEPLRHHRHPTPYLPASFSRWLPVGVDPSFHRSPARHGPRLPCRLVASSPLNDRARGWLGLLEAGSPAGSTDPNPCLEGDSADATRCGDDADAIRFTLESFHSSTYILIKSFM
jgi:hypothetical protein